MVSLNVIDNLYDRTIVTTSVIKNEWMTILYNREPLPVGMHLSGEASEYRMLRVCKDAESAWGYSLLVVLRNGLEHPVVPIVGLEESAHAKVC